MYIDKAKIIVIKIELGMYFKYNGQLVIPVDGNKNGAMSVS